MSGGRLEIAVRLEQCKITQGRGAVWQIVLESASATKLEWHDLDWVSRRAGRHAHVHPDLRTFPGNARHPMGEPAFVRGGGGANGGRAEARLWPAGGLSRQGGRDSLHGTDAGGAGVILLGQFRLCAAGAA